MVSHFHYDPVWWGTQGQFTESRLLLPEADGRLPDVRTAFELVALHLEAARRDPDYKFVLAEIDYLKPHFDAHPEDRADLRRLIAAGRIEIVGGSYNEPNTNLTCAESTIRNAIYGIGYQRDVLGADPRSAWMLDAFGHDPGYPGLMAAAGLTSSAWARGPFHQWGPNGTVGGNERMQFASEFEWISPDGHGLLTSYMANHYGAGWVTHQAADLGAAEQAAYEQFRLLAPVAATRNVMLPVGADHVIPSRWATAIHRDWNARYVWPRFVTALPREFFAAVRAEAASADVWITPQTRDMNPLYPGKDVSYIDTKQAQRAAEIAVTDAERLGTLACARRGRPRVGRSRLPLPGRVAGQGLAAAGVRRPPRRHHRHRVRPGVPGPARRLAGGLAARRRRPPGRGRLPGRPDRHRAGRAGCAGAAGRGRGRVQHAGPGPLGHGQRHAPARRAGPAVPGRRVGPARPVPGRRGRPRRGRRHRRADADVPGRRRARARLPQLPGRAGRSPARAGARPRAPRSRTRGSWSSRIRPAAARWPRSGTSGRGPSCCAAGRSATSCCCRRNTPCTRGGARARGCCRPRARGAARRPGRPGFGRSGARSAAA